MGLSSSQARLLHLTTRMHQIEYKAAKLEAEKLQMANESTRVYEEYLNELERTKIQYSALTTDGSITYNDASYLDLMSGKSGTPYLLYTTGSEKLCLSEELVTLYNSSTSASDFSEKLKNYRSNGSPGSSTWWSDGNGDGGGTPTPINPILPPNPVVPNPNPNPIVPIPNPVIPNPPIQDDDINTYTITREGANTQTINIGTDGIKLNVANVINDDGSTSTLTYTIKSNHASSNATFKILDNGRLYIEGTDLTIDAGSGQKDNIILNGHYNVVNTNDGDDTVRVGIARDSKAFAGSPATPTYENVIDTGSGNDYVETYGENTVNLGSGTDSYFDLGNFSTYSSAENIFNSTSTIDNRDGWAQQNQYGDCKLLALLNSLTGCTNNGSLTNYVNITKVGNNYNVRFKNGETTTVSQSEINSDTNRVDGDMDVVVIEQAIKKVLGDDFYDLGSSFAVSERVAGLLLGQEKYAQANVASQGDAIKEYLFNSLWNMYRTGQISNLILAWGSNSEENGIVTNHAYTVKNLVQNSYVDVVNPWDDRDTIRLSWNDFMDHLKYAIVFGNDIDGLNDLLPINESFESQPETFATFSECEEIIEFNDSASTEDLSSLYYIIGQAIASGNYESIPGDMVNNKSFLVNAIQSGAVYLKEPDKELGKWVGTSVSVATKLREVSDESNLKKAEAKYEADMKKIDRKDRKYDQDLSALEAERNAVKNEMETLKTVAKENVDRTFKLFS